MHQNIRAQAIPSTSRPRGAQLTRAMASVAGHTPFHASEAPVGATSGIDIEDSTVGDDDGEEGEKHDRCPPAQMTFAIKCRDSLGVSKPFKHHPPAYGLHADVHPEPYYLQAVTLWYVRMHVLTTIVLIKSSTPHIIPRAY